MIHLLPLSRVMTWLAVSYGLIIVLILSFTAGNSITDNLKIALGGSTIFHLMLLTFIYIGWKSLWKKFPVLEALFFPDLSGNWNITIDWMDDHGNHGKASGTATIKIDFYKVSMDVNTKDSDSVTLCVRPSKNTESGNPTLHYFYRVTPKFKKGNNIKAFEQYNGAAILAMTNNCSSTLQGNYFTDRYTRGHFVLKREIQSTH